jgi:ankyrin repeat protein
LRNLNGHTPVDLAAWRGRIDVVEELFRLDTQGLYPRSEALANAQRPKTVALLFPKAGSPWTEVLFKAALRGSQEQNWSAAAYLFSVQQGGDPALVRRLIDERGDPALRTLLAHGLMDPQVRLDREVQLPGEKPTSLAGLLMRFAPDAFDVVRDHVDNGLLDLRGLNSKNESLLYMAVRYGCSLDDLQYLIDKGIDVNLQAHTGMTPLHMAVLTKNQAAFDVLLACGARPDIADNQGRTVRDMAPEGRVPKKK